MRVGQKNGLVYQWAKKGSRPRQPKDQRYENAYLFGAVCPSRILWVALIMPNANTQAMQKDIEEISRAVTTGAHALIILDKAGWHTTRKLRPPKNLTLARCRPPARSRTPQKTSANIYARPISPTACSKKKKKKKKKKRGGGKILFIWQASAPCCRWHLRLLNQTADNHLSGRAHLHQLCH